MNIEKIVTLNDKIYIYFNEAWYNNQGVNKTIKIYLPTYPRTLIGQINIPIIYLNTNLTKSFIQLNTTWKNYDLKICQFEVFIEDQKLAGPSFVTEFYTSKETFDYPVATTKKGLFIFDIPDAVYLGAQHTVVNARMSRFLMVKPEKNNTIEFTVNNKTFYFNKKYVKDFDKQLQDLTKAGIITSITLINEPYDAEIWDIVKHPTTCVGSDNNDLRTEFNNTNSKSLISAFNITTEESLDYYYAFVAFLADRYCRADKKYGQVVGFIVGNEVNSAGVWYSAGRKSTTEFTEEYATVLRLSWQIAVQYYSNVRVYLSFDHFWRVSVDLYDKLSQFYKPREMLEIMNNKYLAEGNIPWNVAFHPYTQDLHDSDFWNDVVAFDNDEAWVISFKNLGVMVDFLRQEEYLYKGTTRHITLSEQGFNSKGTDVGNIIQAMAFGIAYKAVMSYPEIDNFIYHAQRDQVEEFGLNLGLWTCGEDGKSLGEKKPIYQLYKEIDQKEPDGKKYVYERF